MTIGLATIIDRKTMDIEFFGYHHYVAPHLAEEFARHILDVVEQAKEQNPYETFTGLCQHCQAETLWGDAPHAAGCEWAANQ